MTTKSSLLGIQRLLRLSLIFPWAIAPGIGLGQAGTPSALDKGLRAARQQEWKLALRYFDEAFKESPDDPSVLFNLALAEAKIPGRELRAVAWFEAYLQAVPTSANKLKVRDQISDLELRAEASVARLIDMLKEMAAKYPDQIARHRALGTIARLQAEAGDVSGVNTTIEAQERLNLDYPKPDRAGVAQAFADAKRIDDAVRMVGTLRDETEISNANAHIAYNQIELGLFDDAERTMAKVPDNDLALERLISALIKAGHIERARALLPKFDASARADYSREKPTEKGYASYKVYAALQSFVEVGDWRGAQKLVPLLIDSDGFAYQQQGRSSIANAISKEVEQKITAKDYPAAESLIAEQFDEGKKMDDYVKLATANPKQAGVIMEKLKPLASASSAPLVRARVCAELAKITALTGDDEAMSRWRVSTLEACSSLLERDGTALNLFRQTLEAAKNSSDVPALRRAIELSSKFLGRSDFKSRDAQDLASRIMRASFDIAAATGKPADAEAARTLCKRHKGHVEAQYMPGNIEPLMERYRGIGDWGAADQLAQLLSDPKQRDEAMARTASRKLDKMIESGRDWDKAAKLIAALPDGETKWSVIERLSDALSGEGEFDRSRQLAETISDPSMRARRIDWLAHELERYRGDHEGAEVMRQGVLTLLDGAARLHKELALCKSQSALDECLAKIIGLAKAEQIPKAQLELWELTYKAAQQAGNFGQMQLAKMELLRLGSVPNSLTPADLVERSVGTRTTDFLGQASDRLIRAANTTAALRIIELTEGDKLDERLAELATKFIKRGDMETGLAIAAKRKNGSANNYHNHQLVAALFTAKLKAGQTGEAKQYAEQFWPGPLWADDMIEAAAEAGEIAWAREWLTAGFVERDYRYNRARTTIVEAALKRGDATDAENVFARMTHDYERGSLVQAAAIGGNFTLAEKWVATEQHPAFATTYLMEPLLAAGKMADAQALVDKITRNDFRHSARNKLGLAQAKAGDLEGARNTLQQAWHEDRRVAPSLDVASQIDASLITALVGRRDFEQALALATVIGNPVLGDNALAELATGAVEDNLAVATSALIAIRAQPLRGQTAVSVAAKAADAGKFAHALALAESVRGTGYFDVAVDAIVSAAIERGDGAVVLPAVVALPDGMTKAHLLCSILRAHTYLGSKHEPVALLAAAIAAAASEPAGLWQVIHLASIAQFMSDLGLAESAAIHAKAGDLAQRLTGDEAERWATQATLLSTRAARIEAAGGFVAYIRDHGATKSAVSSWKNYIEHNLNKPLFTDFKTHLEGIASTAGSGSGAQSDKLFTEVRWQADTMMEVMQKIREMRAKDASKVARN